MPTQKQIAELAHSLHDRKIINLDTSMRDALSVSSTVLNDPNVVADWNVVGGSHYFLVTGIQGGLEKVANPSTIGKTIAQH
ncbi:hypothetical protein U1763_16370 [Sphingomonas sp. LB2R24]|uniref:hypothetical protein n=1 Tax=Sphingomonas TaxID=13687 RepID=UPI00104FBAC4|nr:hypothetical protein [Sphingomonas sp. PP-F2F-A104-K0414]TCQ01233.1 hypothetical protein C8J46_101592 [Sphingomonas sp. PP-F2F-A104-K0414]